MRVRPLCALAAVCLFLIGCGEKAETSSPTTQPAAPVTGELVGTASDDDTFVGIHVADAGGGGEPRVVAYVCNRRVGLEGVPEVAEWFTGVAHGSTVDLTSESGQSHLKATLAANGATGTVQLPDGRTVNFVTVPSDAGPAGVYQVALDEAGHLVGTSRGGKTFTLSPFERDGVPGYTGVVVLADGTSVPYELFVRGGLLTPEAIAGMGTPRTIILADGTSRGILDPIAKKGKATTS